MQGVRIYQIPPCRMVSSGTGMFGDGVLERFNAWFSRQPRGIFPKDFLFWDGAGFRWLYLYEKGMKIPPEFDIMDFPGGLYAVATDIDGKTDREALDREVAAFLEQSGFERDPDRFDLGNVITPPAASKILGYNQMDYYTPIRAKQK